MATAEQSPLLGVTVEQVPLWGVHRGIGHASQYTIDDNMQTACGQYGNGFKRQTAIPKRICRKCRARLPHARLSAQKGKGVVV